VLAVLLCVLFVFRATTAAVYIFVVALACDVCKKAEFSSRDCACGSGWGFTPW
jgi:hypothetical protein